MVARKYEFVSLILRISLVLLIAFPLAQFSYQTANASTQIVITGPAGSDEFGWEIEALPNGNIVVTDPYYDFNGAQNLGAVYLYDGGSGELISMITGSTAQDRVGSHGIYVLENGNYVICSGYWTRSGVSEVGAVTWGDEDTGVNGSVSLANSLVGSTAFDSVGDYGVEPLYNGNYVVVSRYWDNGGQQDVGAVTWGNGETGIKGAVSAANSLVGILYNDRVGYDGVFALANGNYLVVSTYMNNGAAFEAGAITWGDGLTGIIGPVSAFNSLVGSKTNDRVGSGWISELYNGNYVVKSPDWDNGGILDAGAATWADGDTGITGTINSTNSLVGSSVSDMVSYGGVLALTNGNYAVFSHLWDYGSTQDAGAVTWGNGAAGTSGAVSNSNSLIGGSDFDEIGSYGAIGLNNGNYVVLSPNWDNGGIVNAGAATWASGVSGISGLVSTANSLVGDAVGDRVSEGGGAWLATGNYVVSSPFAQINGVIEAGAATWGNGTSGITGTVTISNSLVGASISDRVSSDGVWTLVNGNYVVTSPYWDGPGAVDAGAATFGNGQTGVVGAVTPANSLVGSSLNDHVGMEINPLSNGNYIVENWDWNNGSILKAGAATWGNGTSGIAGQVSPANSLVGSTAQDQVSYYGAVDLSNGNYFVRSPNWDNGSLLDAGAVTWGDGSTGITGSISAANSLVGSSNTDLLGTSVRLLETGEYIVYSPSWSNGGSLNVGSVTFGFGFGPLTGPITSQNSFIGTQPGEGGSMYIEFDSFHRQVVVGLPKQNQVVLYRPYIEQYLPILLK